MCLDDRAGECQPHAHAVRLRREEWLKNLIGKVVGNPGSGIGSDAMLVVSVLSGADDTGLEEIKLPAAVHLAFHELELGDLTFGLAVRPRQVMAALTAA
jgi:hypothetical protein